MPLRPLGASGLEVSAVGIGTNAFGRRVDQEGVSAILDAAREVGATFLDTADIYGGHPGQSEEMLGKALRGRRDRFVVATKFGMDMQGANGDAAPGSRAYVRTAVEASLRRLGIEHIDLYQLHAPDPGTPIAETLGALDELVTEGKVGLIGCSNFMGWQIADAAWEARTAGLTSFVSVQNRYSLLDRTVEADVGPASERFGLGILPYFPLEYGLLTGKYAAGAVAPAGSRAALDPARSGWLATAPWERIAALESFAAERDLAVGEVAIAGLAAKPAVASVIAGVTSPNQVRANAAAMRWVPTAEDLLALARI